MEGFMMKQSHILHVTLMGLVALLLSCDDTQQPQPANEATPHPAHVAANVTPPKAAPAPHIELPLPADEGAFIQSVQQAKVAFHAAANEMAQGGARAQRRAEICKSLTSPVISEWIGQIEELSSNSDGKGVLYVSIAPDVRIETWNNDLSDVEYHTLIDPASKLFAEVSRMKVGDQVSFSGRFFPSEVDCVEEHSMSLDGSMTDPEFVFRFTSVTPPVISQ